MSNEYVLVTGGSGFLGAHCIVQLLNAGYRVRSTVRSLKRDPEVRDMVRRGGADPAQLEIVAADLSSDAGWVDAAHGCTYVHHVASPFPPQQPKSADELVIPARDGALRVLRAARDAGVRRVVLTSSFAAVSYGHPATQTEFSEADWTNLDAEISPYVRSKTVAERAAWDFVAREGRGIELVAINPVAILGPVIGPDLSTSVLIVQQMVDGTLKALPRLSLSVVDVRDVADLHLRAMTTPEAAGERFLASGGLMSVAAAAASLRERLGARGQNIPTRTLPDWIVRAAALFVPTAREASSMLGKVRNASSEKAIRMLGWSPRTPEDSAQATAESLFEFGLVKPN